MDYSLAAIILVVGGVGYYFYNNKLSLREMFQSNIIELFILFSSLASLSEVFSTALLEIKRGEEPFSAFNRYFFAGFFEGITSAAFIKSVEYTLELWKGDKKNYTKIAILIIVPCFTFTFSLGATGFLFSLYLESIGVLELRALSWMNFMFPFAAVDTAVLSKAHIADLLAEKQMYLDAGQTLLAQNVIIPGKVKLGAMFMSYSSTIVNLILVVYLMVKTFVPKLAKDEIPVTTTTTSTSAGASGGSGGSGDAYGIYVFKDVFENVLNITYPNFITWFYEYCGISSTGIFAKKTITNSKCIDETSALKFAGDLQIEILGNATKGVSYIQKLGTIVDTKLTEHQQTTEKMSKAIAKQTDPSSSASDITSAKADEATFKSDLIRITGEATSENNKRIGQIKSLLSILKTHGIKPSTTYVDDAITKKVKAL